MRVPFLHVNFGVWKSERPVFYLDEQCTWNILPDAKLGTCLAWAMRFYSLHWCTLSWLAVNGGPCTNCSRKIFEAVCTRCAGVGPGGKADKLTKINARVGQVWFGGSAFKECKKVLDNDVLFWIWRLSQLNSIFALFRHSVRQNAWGFLRAPVCHSLMIFSQKFVVIFLTRLMCTPLPVSEAWRLRGKFNAE